MKWFVGGRENGSSSDTVGDAHLTWTRRSGIVVLATVLVLIFCLGGCFTKKNGNDVTGDPSDIASSNGGRLEDNQSRSQDSTTDTTDNSGLKWMVAPILEYEQVHYCEECKVFSTEDHDGWAIDRQSGQMTAPWSGGHGGFGYYLLYDEKKDYYGYYSYFELEEDFAMWPGEEYFSDHAGDLSRQYAYLLIDSEKVTTSVYEYSDGNAVHYDLSAAHGNKKFALTYGRTFVTDFIYSDYRYQFKSNGGVDRSAVQLNNKWGIVDIGGNTVIPFYFDDLLFIDEERAFAKYNGKYGILDVNGTIVR